MTNMTNMNNLSLPEITLIILIICFIIVFSIKFYKAYTNKEGFVETQRLAKGDSFIKKTDDDIFDDFYVNMYDDLVYNMAKNNYEIQKIFESDTPNKQHKILDIGCSTGHHVHLLNQNQSSVSAIGIDKSPAMIQKAKKNYPNLNFKLCDALNTMAFPDETFTHITCLYFTIYYMKDKKLFLENCFNWLEPGGVLILHLVDMHKFDPIIPIVDVKNYKYDVTKDRQTDSNVNFETLDYKSSFNIDKSIDANSLNLDRPNAVFRETIKLKTPKSVRINEHNLYMSTQNSILGLAKDTGFSLQSQTEMQEVQYDYNYLYILQKNAF